MPGLIMPWAAGLMSRKVTPTLSYQGLYTNTVSASSRTYSSAPIGTAGANRTVIVIACQRINSNVTGNSLSCTIGGVSATKLAEASQNGSNNTVTTAIFALDVASGTTADVTVSASFSGNRWSIETLAAYNLSSGTIPIDTGTATGVSVNSQSTTVNVSNQGMVIAGSCDALNGVAAAITHTWTGVVETAETYIGTETSSSSASSDALSSETNRSISVAFSRTSSFSALAVVSLR